MEGKRTFSRGAQNKGGFPSGAAIISHRQQWEVAGDRSSKHNVKDRISRRCPSDDLQEFWTDDSDKYKSSLRVNATTFSFSLQVSRSSFGSLFFFFSHCSGVHVFIESACISWLCECYLEKAQNPSNLQLFFQSSLDHSMALQKSHIIELLRHKVKFKCWTASSRSVYNNAFFQSLDPLSEDLGQ